MEENCSKEILSSMLYRSPYLDPVKSKYFLKQNVSTYEQQSKHNSVSANRKAALYWRERQEKQDKERRFQTFADVGGQTWSWKYCYNYQFTTSAAPRRREENMREKQVRVIKGRKCSGKNSRQVWGFYTRRFTV